MIHTILYIINHLWLAAFVLMLAGGLIGGILK